MKLTHISHLGRRVLRAVPTTDGRIHAPLSISDAEIERRVGEHLRTHDSRLDAWSDGKVLALATVWSGELQPQIDARLDALRPLVTGFTSARVLHAEAAAKSLDLGRRWVGDIRGAIRAGARDGERGDGERVDLTDLARSAERLEDALEKRNPELIQSAHDQLRREFDLVRRNHADTARHTADAQFADRGAREAQETRDTIRSMNQRNREFWSGRDANGTRVPTTPVTAVSPASQSTRTRDWAHEIPGGSPFANATSLKFGTSRPSTVSEINRRNREFWAQRNRDDLPPAA